MKEYKKVTKTEKIHTSRGYIKSIITEKTEMPKIENKPSVGTPGLTNDYRKVFESLMEESLRELGFQPRRRR